MSEASDWERFLVDARTDTACPRAREYLQRLMVDCLVEQVDRDVAQILTRYRSYLAVREQRGEPSGGEQRHQGAGRVDHSGCSGSAGIVEVAQRLATALRPAC